MIHRFAIAGLALTVALAVGGCQKADRNTVSSNPTTLAAAGREASGNPDFGKADSIVAGSFASWVNIHEPGATGATADSCDGACFDWWPKGRDTGVPPDSDGPRIYRIQMDFTHALLGKGFATATIWFCEGESDAAAIEARGAGDTTPSHLFQVDPMSTSDLRDLFFPTVSR